jgi:hypothetical protein
LRPEYRIAVGLQVDLDQVTDARIHVIRTREDEDGGPVVCSAIGEHLPRRRAQPRRIGVQGAEAGVDGATRLRQRESGNNPVERGKQLLRYERPVGERHQRCDIAHAPGRERVLLLQEACLDVLRRRHDAGTGQRIHHVAAEK